MPGDSSDDSKIILTRDGSHTIHSPRFNQHYHNPNGAVAESRYVFFEQTSLLGELKTADEITILEVGFGTGLNLMLLLDYYQDFNSSARINFYSVEGFPIKPEVASNLNYRQHLNHPEIIPPVIGMFENLKKGTNHFTFGDNVSMHLFYGMFDNFPVEPIHAQYIFHDAFSPDVNPDLWTGEVFKTIKKLSADNAILSTYCAASKVQGALAWAGWKIAKAKGALGKREMILAALEAKRIDGFKRINEERYARRYEEGDF